MIVLVGVCILRYMACFPCSRVVHTLPASFSSAMVYHAAGALETPLSLLNFERLPTINAPWKLNQLKETNDNPCLPVGYNDYVSLLNICSNTMSLIMGKQVHSRMLITGQEKNMFLAAKLLTMYCSCGSLESARQVFDKICQPKAEQALDTMQNSNVFLWNGMIKGYVQGGACEEALGLYHQMRELGIQPDKYTFTLVLKVCAGQSALQEGMEIHDDISRAGIELDVFVGTALLDMYAKSGRAEVARKLFDGLPQRDQVSWNAMIAGYSQNGHAEESLNLFGAMRMAGVKPSPVTLVSVISACAHLGVLQQGTRIHSYIITSGFEWDVFVGNALIDMYSKCGSVEVACKLFDKMSKKDVISWNSMIAGYAQNGQVNEAAMLFRKMRLAAVIPNSVTLLSLLPAFADFTGLQHCVWIHAYIIKNGFESNISVGNTLLDVYAKCERIELSRKVFDKMSERNVVSWTGIIAGYTQYGHANEALALLYQMQEEDIEPEVITMVSVLPACAHLAALQQGRCIHAYIIRRGSELDVPVHSALLTMYAKCGCIEVARQLFDKMAERDLVSWSAMITGYGMHGDGENALALFSQMQQIGIKPDNITFIGILSACSHAGLVDEGLQYFDCMSQDYSLTPGVEHYACMVDLMGRAGRLDDAHNFIKRMPIEPDVNVWGALLGACRIHSNIELGEFVSKRLVELEPKKVGNYVLLSNIYAAAGRWDNVLKVRSMLKDRGLKKTPGSSWIELKNRVHSFSVGDKSHPQSEKIYTLLESLAEQMKNAGYVPDTSFVLHDVE